MNSHILRACDVRVGVWGVTSWACLIGTTRQIPSWQHFCLKGSLSSGSDWVCVCVFASLTWQIVNGPYRTYEFHLQSHLKSKHSHRHAITYTHSRTHTEGPWGFGGWSICLAGWATTQPWMIMQSTVIKRDADCGYTHMHTHTTTHITLTHVNHKWKTVDTAVES